MSEISIFQMNNPDFSGEISIRYEEPLSKHTSFRIGGKAKVQEPTYWPRTKGWTVW